MKAMKVRTWVTGELILSCYYGFLGGLVILKTLFQESNSQSLMIPSSFDLLTLTWAGSPVPNITCFSWSKSGSSTPCRHYVHAIDRRMGTSERCLLWSHVFVSSLGKEEISNVSQFLNPTLLLYLWCFSFICLHLSIKTPIITFICCYTSLTKTLTFAIFSHKWFWREKSLFLSNSYKIQR